MCHGCVQADPPLAPQRSELVIASGEHSTYASFVELPRNTPDVRRRSGVGSVRGSAVGPEWIKMLRMVNSNRSDGCDAEQVRQRPPCKADLGSRFCSHLGKVGRSHVLNQRPSMHQFEVLEEPVFPAILVALLRSRCIGPAVKYIQAKTLLGYGWAVMHLTRFAGFGLWVSPMTSCRCLPSQCPCQVDQLVEQRTQTSGAEGCFFRGRRFLLRPMLYC